MPSATQNEINGDDAKVLLANGCFRRFMKERKSLLLRKLSMHSSKQKFYTLRVKQPMREEGCLVSGLEMTTKCHEIKWSSEEVE
jgi:glutamate dehydrogenase (NADP+)